MQHPLSSAHTPVALTIAGSDSGGGAGIQADLKTFQMRRVFGCSAVTAVTAQNTKGVFAICPVPPNVVTAQLEAVADDFAINACKIGMLGDVATIDAVKNALSRLDFGTIVLDPVMVAKGGAKLLQDEAIAALMDLLPLVDVVTPNLVELAHLANVPLEKLASDDAIFAAADALLDRGAKAVIAKGGHQNDSQSALCVDWVVTASDRMALSCDRVNTKHTHGTGCSFSACLCAELAKGQSLQDAAKIAKDFVFYGIKKTPALGAGSGPINHWAYVDALGEWNLT